MKLEAVELIMAVEDEFMIEIPDTEAELVISLRQLGIIVEAELGRLHRSADPAKVLNRIFDIAAYFAGVDPSGVGPETTLTEVVGSESRLGCNRGH